jgi:hypothetical protein
MIERGYGIRQSQFEEQTSIVPGSSFGFFFNGYNYQITYDNFISGLGVTGTIAQDGSVTGVAVLDIQGVNNFIRNLEEGSGISLNLSPENGIEIAHNFTIDSVGQTIVQNGGSASPTFVSIEAGTGIAVGTTGTRVVISSTEALSFATVTMAGNSTATTIASTATPVKAAGTYVVGDVSAGYTASTNGRITYTGATSRHIVNALATLDTSTGSNHKISLFIAKNGTVVSTKMTDTISAGAPRALATFINLELEQDDYLDVFVRNESTTDSVIAINVQLSVL